MSFFSFIQLFASNSHLENEKSFFRLLIHSFGRSFVRLFLFIWFLWIETSRQLLKNMWFLFLPKIYFYFYFFGSFFFLFEFGIVNGDQNDGKGAVEPSNVVVIAPVATNEDEDEDDATINKWSKFRVKALKFNENTYYSYIVLAIIFIASIALVRSICLLRLYIALPAATVNA